MYKVLKYDRSQHFDLIMQNAKRAFSKNRTAMLCRIPPSTFKDWLDLGEKHICEGKETEVAELAREFYYVQAEKSLELTDALQKMPKCWQAVAWYLERCMPDDFSDHAAAIERMQNMLSKMQEAAAKKTK